MLVGIVGKPSSGKSTFFKALTMAEAEIADYPFTTIKPNHGVGFVRVKCACKDFGKECGKCRQGWRFVPIELLDVAGLVPGAHEGKGMGNQFLDDLRRADVLIHVVDASGTTNEKGEKCEPGSYDPENEVEFLKKEIDQWFLRLVKKDVEEVLSRLKHSKIEVRKELTEKVTGLNISEKQLERSVKQAGLDFNRVKEWSEEDFGNLASELREIKPIIIAANKIDLPSSRELPGSISVSALAELALRKAMEQGRADYVPGSSEFGLDTGGMDPRKIKGFEIIRELMKKRGSTGVQECLNKAVLDVLGFIVVFPVEDENKLSNKRGEVMPDALLMPPGSTVIDLAFKVHNDIGKGFVKGFDCRTRKPVSKEHELKMGDVIKIFSK